MGEASFTPGPWSVKVDDQSGIGRTHSVYICTKAGWPEGQLARVNVQDGLGEREANARLIAAAPDLYEAVAAFLAYDAGDDDAPDAGVRMMLDYDHALTLARAALAKANGETAA